MDAYQLNIALETAYRDANKLLHAGLDLRQPEDTLAVSAAFKTVALLAESVSSLLEFQATNREKIKERRRI